MDDRRRGGGPAVWRLHRCRPERAPTWYGEDPVLAGVPTLAELAEANGTRPDQEFLIRSDGLVVAAVNAFLASPRMTGRSAGTRDKYGRGLCTWLGYLDAVGRPWNEAGEADVDGFKFWRMTDAANPSRVAGATVLDNLSAVNAFYEWAQPRYATANPVTRRHLRPSRGTDRAEPFTATPHVVRQRDVKWLDPGGYACWRDIGLRGLDRSGREVDRWRGRNSQRDCAFADGLYGTGLRLAEWSSMLMMELPADDPTRGYATCWLASECAKGRRGRRYWMPRAVLTAVLAYGEGERAAAVRRAQQAGRYDTVPDPLVLARVLGRRRMELADRSGLSCVSLDSLTPSQRRRIFTLGPNGFVPAALWLNEDGLPREAHGWQHTFDTANDPAAELCSGGEGEVESGELAGVASVEGVAGPPGV